MKRLRILRRVMRETGANRIWMGFLLLFFACAFVIWLLEPEIQTYGKALWYCYAVVTTIGFGDVVALSPVSRILSVFLSIVSAITLALVTGVIVNYFTQLMQLRNKETLTALIDKLERLPELSREELTEVSRQIRDIRDK